VVYAKRKEEEGKNYCTKRRIWCATRHTPDEKITKKIEEGGQGVHLGCDDQTKMRKHGLGPKVRGAGKKGRRLEGVGVPGASQ